MAGSRLTKLVATVLLLVAIPVAVTTCGKETTGLAHAGPAALMKILSGDQQSAQVGTELPTPLVVKVLDAQNRVVSGQVINFVVTAGGGRVFGGAENTNDSGIAQERWTLGTSTADSQRVEARAVDNVTGAKLTFAVFGAIALAGPAAAASITAGGFQTGAVGAALPESLSVKVVDRYTNLVPGQWVHWSVLVGGGSLSADSTVTGASGVAKVSWTLGARLDTTQVVRAVVGTVATLQFTATPFAARVRGSFIAAAENHTCALDTLGRAYCWGLNSHGQLGDGTTTMRLIPVPVSGGLALTQLAIGSDGSDYEFACGLTSAGAAYCWGGNYYGQLVGDGIAGDHLTPVPVTGGLTFTQLATMYRHTCGLASGGAAYCWGVNSHGEIGGVVMPPGSVAPTPVSGGLTFKQVVAGFESTCGLTTAGAAYCWGLNNNGQLGDGTMTDRSAPVPVSGGLTFVSLTAGNGHYCAITTTGATYCWGWNGWGDLGDGTTTSRSTPVAVHGGLTFVSLASFWSHTCGLTSGGVAYCWGLNDMGQLGDGTQANRTTPVPVGGGLLFLQLAPGSEHTCGLATSRAIYCWGKNADGQLGDGTTTNRLAPTEVAIF